MSRWLFEQVCVCGKRGKESVFIVFISAMTWIKKEESELLYNAIATHSETASAKDLVIKILGKELCETLENVQWKTEDEDRRKNLDDLLWRIKEKLVPFEIWRVDRYFDTQPNSDWKKAMVPYPELQESLNEEQKLLLKKWVVLVWAVRELQHLFQKQNFDLQWELYHHERFSSMHIDNIEEYVLRYWEIKEIGLSVDMWRKIDHIIEVWVFQHALRYIHYCIAHWYKFNYEHCIDRMYDILMVEWTLRGLWWIDAYDEVVTWHVLGQRYDFPQENGYDFAKPLPFWDIPDLWDFIRQKGMIIDCDKDMEKIREWVNRCEQENSVQWLTRCDRYHDLWGSLHVVSAQAKYAPVWEFIPETIDSLRKKCYFYRALYVKNICELSVLKKWIGIEFRWRIFYISDYIYRYGEEPEQGITKAWVDDYLKKYVYVERD